MIKLAQQEGFTIVEIITGLVVLTLFVLSISSVTTNLIFINDRSYDQVLINGLVENKIESLRSAGFNSLVAGEYDFSDELHRSIGSPKSATYTITDVSDPAIGDALKQVDFEIEYTIGGTTETVEFSSMLGELGIGQ